MGTTSLKDKVIDRVQRYDWTTYVELGNLAAESVGAGTWAHQDINTNVVFWAGMSEEVATAIDEAFAEGYIHPHGSDSLVYMMDGGMLKLPLAKRPPKGGYKKEHWAPVVFRPGRSCTDKGCPWNGKPLPFLSQGAGAEIETA